MRERRNIIRFASEGLSLEEERSETGKGKLNGKRLQNAHSDGTHESVHLRSPDCFQNARAFRNGDDCGQRVGGVFPAEAVQTRGGFCPKAIGKAAEFLFELPEHGFYAETISVQPDDGGGMKIQIKAELLIKPLAPEKVDGVILNGLFPSVQVDFPCPEEGLFRFKEVG